MANMHYCRYENTYRNLRDCWEIVEGMDIERLKEELSKSEFNYLLNMIELCKEIAQNYDDL